VRQRVDALLREGLESGPATPMTDWEGLRKLVRQVDSQTERH
jgi:hypothetical protein